MPAKTSDRTPTETFLKLLVLLLESTRPLSLRELSDELGVSKQSILKYLDRLDMSYFGELEKLKYGKETVFKFTPRVKKIKLELFCDKDEALERFSREAKRKVAKSKKTGKSKKLGKSKNIFSPEDVKYGIGKKERGRKKYK